MSDLDRLVAAARTLVADIVRAARLRLHRDHRPPQVRATGTTGPRWRIEVTGLRNPWRFTFDHGLAEMWIADVGQDETEEVNRVHLDPDPPPPNLGWSTFEGNHRVERRRPLRGRGRLTWPVATYTHTDGCSITGGPIYHGTDLPGLAGRYVYGDFCTGAIWSLEPAPNRRATDIRRERATAPQLTHIGTDSRGELVFATATGTLHRAVPPAES